MLRRYVGYDSTMIEVMKTDGRVDGDGILEHGQHFMRSLRW